MDKELFKPKNQLPTRPDELVAASGIIESSANTGTNTDQFFAAVYKMDQMGRATVPAFQDNLIKLGRLPGWKKDLKDQLDAAEAAGEWDKVQELVRVGHLMGITEPQSLGERISQVLGRSTPAELARFQALYVKAELELANQRQAATQAAAVIPTIPPVPTMPTPPTPVPVAPITPPVAPSGPAAGPTSPSTSPATAPATPTPPDITREDVWPKPERLVGKSPEWIEAFQAMETKWAIIEPTLPEGTGQVPTFERYSAAFKLINEEILAAKSAPVAGRRIRPMIEYLLVNGKIWKEPRMVKRFLRDHVSVSRAAGAAIATNIPGLKPIVRETYIPEGLKTRADDISKDQATEIRKIYRTFQFVFHPDRVGDMPDSDKRLVPIIEILHDFMPVAWKQLDEVLKRAQ